MSEDFFSAYLKYVEGTEPPVNYHRWCCIASIAALLGRAYALPHGDFILYPNIYCMLIGASGDRKSTAIKMAKKFIVEAGFPKSQVAADKTSKEKFLMDLAGIEDTGTTKQDPKDVTIDNLWGDTDLESRPPAEMFIMADEFNEFMGNGNIDFISMLGNLWDYNGVYKSRVKNSSSVSVPNPTISILGGNTPTNFTLAFPPETLGQGFFSRLLLIHGAPSGRKITWPRIPSSSETADLAERFNNIKRIAHGTATISDGAKLLLDKIYHTWEELDDVRFTSYSNRRFTHLLKLVLVISAASYTKVVTEEHVVHANTVLTHAESFMPKALGEFGKARDSDIVHKLLQYLDKAVRPVKFKEMWKQLSNDLNKMNDLTTILSSLLQADKIQSVGADGFLRKKKATEQVSGDTLDYERFLTLEERNMQK